MTVKQPIIEQVSVRLHDQHLTPTTETVWREKSSVDGEEIVDIKKFVLVKLK